MKRFFLLFFAGLLIGGLLTAEEPEQELATLVEISGSVFVRAAGDSEWQKAEAGMALVSGDVVKTGANSSAEIMTGDETNFSLEENSEFVAGEKQSAVERWYLNLGKLLVRVSKKISAGSKFEVKTPVAVCAVRGTEFAIETTAADSNIAVLAGEVQADSVLVPQPEPVTIIVNQEIIVPRRITGILRPVPLGVRWAWAHRRRAYVLKRAVHWRAFLRRLPREKRILLRRRAIRRVRQIQRIKRRHNLPHHYPGHRH